MEGWCSGTWGSYQKARLGVWERCNVCDRLSFKGTQSLLLCCTFICVSKLVHYINKWKIKVVPVGFDAKPYRSGSIQGIHKRIVRFQKLTRNLFLTLHGHNLHRQQRQLSKFLMRYQQFASHAYCGAAGPVSKMASQQEKAFCVLSFEVSRSVITVQREFRARFRKGALCVFSKLCMETHAAL